MMSSGIWTYKTIEFLSHMDNTPRSVSVGVSWSTRNKQRRNEVAEARWVYAYQDELTDDVMAQVNEALQLAADEYSIPIRPLDISKVHTVEAISEKVMQTGKPALWFVGFSPMAKRIEGTPDEL